MNRAILIACLNIGLLCAAGTGALAQQAGPVGHAAHKAVPLAASPASYEVQITPTKLPMGSTSIEQGDDRWIARGFDLRSLIAQVYEVEEKRIDFAAAAETRYDLVVMLPADVTDEATKLLLQKGLERRFGLVVTREIRPMDVYVLTAPRGPGPALHMHTAAIGGADGDEPSLKDVPRFSSQGRSCPGIHTGGLSASAGSIAEFGRTLEPDMDRPVLNETALPGSFDFQIGEYRSREELFQLMRDRLGLVVTPARRSVAILAVRPAASAGREVGAF